MIGGTVVLVRGSIGPMNLRDERIWMTASLLSSAVRSAAGAGDGDADSPGGGTGTGVVTATKPKTQKPSMYKVLLLNDDYTPMEFVVHVLERFFNKSQEEATKIMLHVHQRGVGICGIYPYEVAESKVTQVVDFARKHQHPLQCTFEKD
jgi:ATP-dependent Clp protease adaptor protein ClpS